MQTRQSKKNEHSKIHDWNREPRAPLQREVVRGVMLSAAECDTWLTLEELARMTAYAQASISAQLRHLRKEEYGGYRLRKRCRTTTKFMGGVDLRGANGPVWEYRLDRCSDGDRTATQDGAPRLGAERCDGGRQEPLRRNP
jgi:hypothetical protein